jgi:hypothetical protein
MKETQRKLQLEKQLKIDLNKLTKNDHSNNAYYLEIKIRIKALKKKLAHRKAQQKWREAHPNYSHEYYLKQKNSVPHS